MILKKLKKNMIHAVTILDKSKVYYPYETPRTFAVCFGDFDWSTSSDSQFEKIKIRGIKTPFCWKRKVKVLKMVCMYDAGEL